MFWFKTCPRCKGDLYDERDHFGRYVACLQCGHELTDAEETAVLAAGTSGPFLPGSKRAIHRKQEPARYHIPSIS